MKSKLSGVLFLILPLLLASPWASGQAALKIYAMESWPISFTQDGQPAGLVVDMAREVQRRLGGREAIEIVPWKRAHVMAEGEANVLLLSIIRTPERDQYLRYIGPVFQLHLTCYAQRSRAASLRASDPGLRKLRAGARRGSVFIKLARDAGYNLTEEINSSEIALRMLMAGRFELWFDGEEIVTGALRRAGYDPNALEVMIRLGTQDVNFAFSTGTPDATLRAWEGALRAMRRDGSYQAIHRRWLPGYPVPSMQVQEVGGGGR